MTIQYLLPIVLQETNSVPQHVINMSIKYIEHRPEQCKIKVHTKLESEQRKIVPMVMMGVAADC